MASENLGSTVLHEHRKIVNLRHLLALVNFLAILAGTLVTRHFVLVRGTADGILVMINILWIINIIQIGFCLADYIIKVFFGKYFKWLVIVSYVIGLVWFLAVVTEFIIGSVVLGDLRIDLGVIAILQLLTALMAYIIWPHLDHLTLKQMTRPSVRDDSQKRAKKAKTGVIRYVAICSGMVLLQAAMLFAYKLPPKVYDLFSESRALQYQLSEDGESYEVIGVYHGTSSYVNVPARYNGKPVTKIKSDALSNSLFLEGYKIDTIDIGTLTEDENGKTTLISNVTNIEAGAINNDKIVSLTLPESVVKIEAGAIQSLSLKTLTYEAKADFAYSYLDCSSLSTITFEGEDVGKIVSLDGMNSSVTLEVAKDIYNNYREKNVEYMSSIRPILEDDEFVVDFYTNTDYYIESIFCKVGETFELRYQDLKNDKIVDKYPLSVDTLAYIQNKHETGTDGAKQASAFRGWYYDSTFSEECVFENNKAVFTGDTAIYAKWIDEYTGTLDWGTYYPDGQTEVLYWTDEDLVTFPVINDREGFDGGIVWYINDKQVTSSQNISENVTVSGKWLFNAPTIDINPYAQNSQDTSFVVSTDKNTVNFTYDEYQSLYLDAMMQHDFDGREGFGYATDWVKVDDSNYSSNIKTVNVKNVLESGEYVLTVTATSPYGDTSTAQTRIKVQIAKKELDIGTARLDDTTYEYNAQYQTLERTGNVVAERVQIVYTYYDKDGNVIAVDDGVKDAGKYRVVAEFKKNNASEAENYGTKELNANLTITPCQLEFISWSESELTYNTAQQSVQLTVGGILGTDDVDIIYENNTATDAAEYVAKAVGVSNPNYSISEMGNNATYEWKIVPKEISVKEWKLDGSVTSSFSIVYNGETHVLEAVADGVYASDVENVNFIYDQTANTVTAVDANQYTAKIIGVDNPNYKLIAESSQAWEIEKRTVSVYFDNKAPITYNGENQGINATISGIVGKDLELFTRDKLEYDGKSEAVTVGEAAINDADVVISFTARDVSLYNAGISAIAEASDINLNYTLIAAERSFEIIPKTLTVVSEETYTYNGKPQNLSVKIVGLAKSDLDADSVSYDQFTSTTLKNGSKSEDGAYYLLTLTGKEAGDYSYDVTAFNNPNYTIVSSSGVFTINKKPLEVSWNITDLATNDTQLISQGTSVTYNFNGYNISADVIGVVDGETVSLSYVNNEAKNAQSYRTEASLADSYNNYYFETAYLDWTVVPYTVDFTWSFNGEIKSVENGAIPEIEYSAKEVQVSPVYTLLGTDEIAPSFVYGKADVNQTNARDEAYKVEILSLGNSNYTVGSCGSFNWKITPKRVDISWGDTETAVTYDGAYHGPKFTLSGVIENDRHTEVTVGTDCAYFKISSLDSDVQYNFADTKMIRNAAGYDCNVVGIYKLDENSAYVLDTNYQVSGVICTYTIDMAPLTLGGWMYSVSGEEDSVLYTDSTKLIYNRTGYVLSNSINEALFSLDGVTDDVRLSYSGNSYSAANQYCVFVSLSGAHAENYYIDGTTYLNWQIHKKPISANWTTNNFVYNGSTKYQNATYIDGAVSADDKMVYTGDSLTFSYNGNGQVNAGIYVAEIYDIGNNNYELVENVSYEWSIAQQEVDYAQLSWSAESFVYNATSQKPTAYYYDTVRYAYVYASEYDASDVSRIVGNYSIKATALEDSNYKLVGTNNGHTYAITPKTLNFTWSYGSNTYEASNYEYDGVTRTIYAHDPDIYDGDTVELTYSTDDLTICNAGEYTYTVTGINNSNYQITSDSIGVTKTVVVSPRTVSLSWGYDGQTSGAGNFTYDGYTKQLKAYAYNLCDGDAIDFTYSEDSNRALRDAGSYTVKVESITGASAANYTLSSSSYNCQKTITVSPQTLTLTWSGNTSVNYDGKSHALEAILTGTIAGKSIEVAPVYSDTNSFINASSYTVTVKDMGSCSNTVFDKSNFSLPSSPYQYLTINKQTLSITWAGDTNVTYDGEKHSLVATLHGTIDGRKVTATAFYSTTNGGIDAGSYEVYVSGIGISGDSDFDTANFTLPSERRATLTIDKCQAYVTWTGSQTVTYDGEAHSLVATVTDKDGNDVSFIYTGYGNSYTNAGSYTVYVSLDDPYNYTLTGQTTSKKLTINKHAVSVSWSGDSIVTYDGKAHSLTASVTDGNGNDVGFTYSGNSYTTAGAYTISITLDDENNYTASGQTTSKTLTIGKRTVSIVWSGETTVTYDGNYHSLTAKVTGEYGNTVEVNYINNDQINVGTYSVGISLVDTVNYKLPTTASTTKTLTIKPQSVRISWTGAETYTYTGQTFTLKPAVYGAIDDRDISDYCYLTGTNSFSNAGTYTCTVSGLSDSNYTLEDCDGSLSATATVKPVDITITWKGDGTVEYNGYYHYVTATVTDEFGNTIDANYQGSNYGITSGTYVITLELPGLSTNYNVVSGSTTTTLTILDY